MKFTAIILIALLFAVAGAAAQTVEREASAQAAKTDEIVTVGHDRLTQSMLDRLTGFFEWSLDIELSDAERAEFQADVVENWKNGETREIRGVLYILELDRELDHLDGVKRAQAQILLRDRFLQELEYRSSNRINALLLASYREKHGRIDNLTALVKQ